MPYLYSDFEGVPLPPAMTKDDLGSGSVASSLQESVGGVFDYAGDGRRLPKMHRFTHRGLYEAGSGDDLWRVTAAGDLRVASNGHVRIVADAPLRWLGGQIDAIKAMIGVRGKLWRTGMPDGVRQWRPCRLLNVRIVAEVDDAGQVGEVETTWESADVGWRSAAASTVQASGSVISLQAQHPGPLPIWDAVLSVARTSGTITRVDVTAPGGVALRWNGSLGSGQTLVIDSGALSVRRNGASAYSGFGFLPAHSADGWMILRPGVNGVTVVTTGGNATATLEFYPRWP